MYTCTHIHVHVHASDLSLLPTRGPCSKYELDLPEGQFKGKLIFTLEGGILRVCTMYMYVYVCCSLHIIPSPPPLQGIACNLDSDGFKKLDEATRDVLGESNPYSICGSLPLVGDLQNAGFKDVQVALVYHFSRSGSTTVYRDTQWMFSSQDTEKVLAHESVLIKGLGVSSLWGSKVHMQACMVFGTATTIYY